MQQSYKQDAVLLEIQSGRDYIFPGAFFVVVATPWGIGDLSFPTRDQTLDPCSGNAES